MKIMPLENFAEYEARSTIKFPNPLDHEGSQSLLRYIATEKRHYQRIESSVDISEIFESSNFKERHVKRTGNITITKPPFLIYFEFFRYFGEENDNRYNGIKFNSIGKKPAEIPDSEIQIWGEVRESVNNYFQQREINNLVERH